MAWNASSSDLTIRDSLIKSFTLTKFDSLKYFEQQSMFERAKNESNLDLEYFKFKINNYLLANFPNEKALIKLYDKLNNDLANYNAQTKDYNVYISIRSQKQYSLKIDKMFNFKTVKDEKKHI